MIVYAHTSPSGKTYVGWTVKSTPDARWKEHVRSARAGSQYPFHCAIRKYGERAFRTEILERACSADEARAAEKKWIRVLGSHVSGGRGYNATMGGEGMTGPRPPEHGRAISAAKKGKGNFRTYTAADKAACSRRLRAVWSDPVRRAALLDARSRARPATMCPNHAERKAHAQGLCGACYMRVKRARLRMI